MTSLRQRLMAIRERGTRWLGAGFANRVMVYALALTLGVALLIGVLAYATLRSQIRAGIEGELAGHARLAEQRLGLTLHELDEHLAILARNPIIASGLVDSAGREAYLLPFLRAFRVSLPGVEHVVTQLYDFAGQPILGSGQPGSALAAVGRAIADGKPRAEIVAAGSQRFLKLVYPVHFPPTRSVEGALSARVDLGALLRAAGQGLPPHLHVRLNAAGRPLLGDGAGLAPRLEVLRPLRPGGALDALGLELVVGSEAAWAYAPLRRLTQIAAAGTLVLMLLTAWLARLLARRLAQPLLQISAAAEGIAAGDDPPVPHWPGREDEVGQLSDALAIMLRGLNHGREELERQVAERTAALQASEARLRAILDAEPECVKLIGPDGRLLQMNPAGLAMIEAQDDPARVIGKKVADLVVPEHRFDFSALTQRVLKGGQGNLEFEIVGLKGTRRWLDTRAVPLWDEATGEVLLLGLTRDITARKRAEHLNALSQHVLQRVVGGAPLAEVLEYLAHEVEAITPGMLASLLLMDADGLHVRHGAAPSLPEAYNRAVDGAPIGPNAGSCGTAAWRREQVIVADIATDPLWADYRELALAHGLRACWSTPILSRAGEVLGTFALYYHEPHAPTPAHLQLIDHVISLAAVVIERTHEELELRRHVGLVETSGDMLLLLDTDLRYRIVNPPYAAMLCRAPVEIIGRSVAEIVGPQTYADIGPRLKAALAGANQNFVIEALRPDGRTHAVHADYRTFYEQGKVAGVVVSLRDITPIRQAEQTIRASEARLKEAQRIAGLGSWELELATGTLTWSDETYRIFELDPARVTDFYEAFLATVHPEDRDTVDRAFQASLQSHNPYEFVHRLRMADGRVKWVHERGETAYDGEGRPLRTVGTVQDITERKQAEEQLRLAARVFDSSSEGITITDAQGIILTVNDTFTRITGYTAAEVIGRNPRILQSGRQDRDFYQNLWASLGEAGQWQGEIWNRRKNGEVYPEWLSISAIQDEAGCVGQYIAIFSDITERMAAAAHIQHLAHYDALTDLPNRALLLEQLNQAVHAAQRGGDKVAVLFLDLDRFKYVNDSLGHQAGDWLLVEVASRLKACVRESDTVARLGGDEFVIVLSGMAGSGAITLVVEKLVSALKAPMQIEDRELSLTPSIGISLFPDDGREAGDLIRNADTAMYQAKEAGRDTFRFYEADMNARAMELLGLEAALRRALEREEFFLLYQPKVDLESGRMTGVEALIRWRHPELGLVSPGRFIPLAEETGLILPIGDWALRTACHQAVAWRTQGLALSMAVNLSVRQFRQRNLAQQVAEVLADTGLDPAALEIEITESAVMHDPEEVIAILRVLKATGVRLAIDDFGTGYSSLNYLKRFHVDVLKIDQSFIRDAPTDPEDAAIVQAVIDLARTLGMQVVAEGVETEAHLDFVRRRGCDLCQGYYFARPLPPDELLAWQRARPQSA